MSADVILLAKIAVDKYFDPDNISAGLETQKAMKDLRNALREQLTQQQDRPQTP